MVDAKIEEKKCDQESKEKKVKADDDDDDGLTDFPYNPRVVHRIAAEVDYFNWRCTCCDGHGPNDDCMHGTKGDCPECAWGGCLNWCCGGVECHEENCTFEEGKHRALDPEELIERGLLKVVKKN